ncbi:hypothetical protein SFC07_06665 [Corynebacterium callunae]|uniref:hypothetical protein n=1 Tax=Corynebacterium callunae TaxID=1721 RepID=UPI0039828104
MAKFRTAAVALATAGALALTATPAMAQSSASSDIGTASSATEYERDIWGSSKDLDEVSDFGVAWYGYTLAITAAAAAGVVWANATNIENAAAQFGIHLDIPGV